MRTILLTWIIIGLCQASASYAQTLEPCPQRVNVQQDSAQQSQIIDQQWVAVGIKKRRAIQKDSSILWKGKPSYRFELQAEDNTLKGYAPGETKGRAELCYCYATNADFAHLPANTYRQAQQTKTVYYYGKGSCPQGATLQYTFSIYVPRTLSPRVSTIFAQWHGMPNRTLVRTPQGQVKQLTAEEFEKLSQNMIFKKDQGYEKITLRHPQGQLSQRAGAPTGWKIEQGGYPPLAFGFSKGFFYIKANSDRQWFSDKDDRCQASIESAQVMQPVTSTYKSSTLAYKLPFDDFPKEQWVTFHLTVRWTRYGKEAETIVQPGKLSVSMTYQQHSHTVTKTLVDTDHILLGRNDEAGYYFKFGIYRVGHSTEPVSYHLAGYQEQLLCPTP